MLLISSFFLVFIAASAYADTYANCTHYDLLGTWTIIESQRGSNSSELCSGNLLHPVRKFTVKLLEPNIAKDENGNIGFWTAVYNQGFELVIQKRKYFSFSYYVKEGEKVTSYCNKTFPGWSHDVLGNNWACYQAKKPGDSDIKVHVEERFDGTTDTVNFDQYLPHWEGKTWTSAVYPEFSNAKLGDLLLRAGGHLSKVKSKPKPADITPKQLELDQTLPLSFDWRNISGTSFVSPIRNQGSCGSCYSFASMAMLEARLRIATNNKDTSVFSPQDVVSCSEYSQGCAGGFPYLIAGKYGQDFGVTPENCFPYSAHDTGCREKKCIRYYTSDYSYVGGYFGACNEGLMKAAIVKNGPIAIGFEVTPEFMAYKGGIFKAETNFNHPAFQETNHAVLIVGYGFDEVTGLKYWSVKNSWGETWGEQGYFRIRRGNDDLHIESMAVEASIIPY